MRFLEGCRQSGLKVSTAAPLPAETPVSATLPYGRAKNLGVSL
jgi:hypothetical protein